MRKGFINMTLLVMLLFPCWVNAEDFVTNEGYTIPQIVYNDLLKIFSPARIETMPYDNYQQIMSLNLDFDNVQKDVKYIKTEYNNITGQSVETEITEAEYNNLENIPSTMTSYVETNYKKQVLNLIKTGSAQAYAELSLVWKVQPAVRSFDVIAMRDANLNLVNGTQTGYQIYNDGSSSTNSSIRYAFDGTNINNQSNGFGISMNLKNGSLSYLECVIDAIYTIEGYAAHVFGSYQHATSDVSLATSKNYTLDGSGMGHVILFNNNISSYYDGMQGTHEYITG